jgi:ribosome-associated protein
MPSTTSQADLARVIAEAADERKGSDIIILHVAEVSYLADYFILVTGFSKPQVRAIVQSIQAAVAEKLQRTPRRIEGLTDSTWVLMDFGEAIVHVLLPREREYYNLEAFWGHAERVPFFSTQ